MFNSTAHLDTEVPFTPSLHLPRPPPLLLLLLTGHATVDLQQESATDSELSDIRKLGPLLQQLLPHLLCQYLIQLLLHHHLPLQQSPLLRTPGPLYQ